MAQFKTITTDPGVTSLLVNATEWTVVSVQLDTSGPCIIGNVETLGPVNAGRGVQIGNIPRYMVIRPGERLYIYSDLTDSVGVIAEPLPFLVGNALSLLDGVAKLMSSVTGKTISSPGKKC